MGNYKRCAVVFNLDNPMQSDLYEWCIENSTNFSDFARSIIFSYRQSQNSNSVTVQSLSSTSNTDANKMQELF